VACETGFVNCIETGVVVNIQKIGRHSQDLVQGGTRLFQDDSDTNRLSLRDVKLLISDIAGNAPAAGPCTNNPLEI